MKLIPKNPNPLLSAKTIYATYRPLLPSHAFPRIWVKFDMKLGKFVKLPIGRNVLAKFASKVALALKKEDPLAYLSSQT